MLNTTFEHLLDSFFRELPKEVYIELSAKDIYIISDKEGEKLALIYSSNLDEYYPILIAYNTVPIVIADWQRGHNFAYVEVRSSDIELQNMVTRVLTNLLNS